MPKESEKTETSIVSVTLDPKKRLSETPFSSADTSNEFILPPRRPTPEITVGVGVVSFPPVPPLPPVSGRQLTFAELPPEEFSLGYGSYKTSTFDPKIYVERLQNRIHKTSYQKTFADTERFEEIPIYISNTSNVLQFSDEGTTEYMKLDVPSVCYITEAGSIVIIVFFIFLILLSVYYFGFVRDLFH